MERANTERTQVELEQPLRRHVAAQRRGELAARGQDGGDRFVFEARQRISQQRQRGCVQPLEVVHGEQKRVPFRKPPQHVQEREGDEALLHGSTGVRKGKRHVQRPHVEKIVEAFVKAYITLDLSKDTSLTVAG